MDIKRMLVDPRVAALVVQTEAKFRPGAQISSGSEQMTLYALWLSQWPEINDNVATLKALGAILDRPDTNLHSVTVGGNRPLESIRYPTSIDFSLEQSSPEGDDSLVRISSAVGNIPALLAGIPIVVTVYVSNKTDDPADAMLETSFTDDSE